MALVEEDFETVIKVIVVGNGSVGKTSLIRRFCTGNFTDNYKKTIGVDFLERELFVDSQGEAVRLMIWDTAGQEEFDAITRTYYRDRDSFEAIEGWKAKVEQECGSITQVLVQNKTDLLSQAVVQPKEAEDLATRMGVRFYRASVKDDVNVSQVFDYCAEQFLEKGGAVETQAQTSPSEPQRTASPIDEPMAGGDTQQPFKLGAQQPSRQRTGGKKSCF